VVNLKTATVLAGVIAVVLFPRAYATVETAISVFPIDPPDAIVFVDLDPVPWIRVFFAAAHACVAWFVVLWWRGNATSWLKILTLIVLGELTAIYLAILRFWYGGISIPLY
jgi:hypothetical protein